MSGGNHTHRALIFPVLKNEDILACMKEINVDLSQEELAEPQQHKDRIREVFMLLWTECTGKTEVDLQANQAMKDKAASIPHGTQFHNNNHFGEILFFLSLKSLILTCGVPNFSMRDLHYPTAKRFRVQLSGLINYVKFLREQLTTVFAPLLERREELIMEIEQAHEEHLELEAQLSETELMNKDKVDAMTEIQEECLELEMLIARNNKLQSSVREEGEALKTKAKDLKDELATTGWALEEAEAEEGRLRCQVVSSPDRRRDDLKHREERLKHEKEACSQLDKQIQLTKAKTVVVQCVTNDIQTTINVLDNVKTEVSKHSDLVKSKQETVKELDTLQKATSETKENCQELERDVKRKEQEISHQAKSHKIQMDAAQDALTRTKKQLVEVAKDRRDEMARAHTGEETVRQLRALLEKEELECEAEISEMIQEYKEEETVFLNRDEKRMALLVTDNV